MAAKRGEGDKEHDGRTRQSSLDGKQKGIVGGKNDQMDMRAMGTYVYSVQRVLRNTVGSEETIQM